jgi:Transmembrane domain of unknown function (DUF3566)
VSSPDDPGYPVSGDPANGNGPRPGPSRATSASSVSTTGPLGDPGEVPPWQRGPGARARQAQRRPADAHAAGVEGRAKRFPSGTAPGQAPADVDGPGRNEAYQSELPDLSGPLPRPPAPRKQPVERAAGEPSAGRSAAPTSRIQVGPRARGGPVRASMQIRRVDPWSVLKVSLILSVSLFFVWMIAVAFLYLVLGGMGVWSKLNSNVGDLLTAQGGSPSELVSSGAIFGGAALIGLVNIVLLTAMATVGAFIYNLTTDLVGGVEVTLADRD